MLQCVRSVYASTVQRRLKINIQYEYDVRYLNVHRFIMDTVKQFQWSPGSQTKVRLVRAVQ